MHCKEKEKCHDSLSCVNKKDREIVKETETDRHAQITVARTRKAVRTKLIHSVLLIERDTHE